MTMRVLIVAAALLAAAPAGAQDVASSMDQLRVLVKSGDNIKVTDAAGRTTSGTIEFVTSSGIGLLANGATLTMSPEDIETIRVRQHRDYAKGARNGFLVGAGLGLLGGLAISGETGAPFVLFATLVYGATGAGIGVGIDSMIWHDQVIYASRAQPPAGRFGVAPLLGRDRKGVVVSLGL